MNDPLLILLTFVFLAAILITSVLTLIQRRKTNKIKREIEELEIEKNKIESSQIIPELSKVESIMKNEKLELMYNDWKERLEYIQTKQIPTISDMLIDADYSLRQTDYKTSIYKIAKLEMEIYKVRTNSELLLKEIKEITESDEKNRNAIIKLKQQYRDLYQKFNSTKEEYKEYAKYVQKQFEIMIASFEDFENAMDNNEYLDIPEILKGITEMLQHMAVIIDEAPSIILLTSSILPKTIDDLYNTKIKMERAGYPLDYLNIDYNIKEADKKIVDINNRLKDLNIVDSLFELKVLVEYFDGLFKDLDKEKVERKNYEDISKSFIIKLRSINSLVNDMYSQMDQIIEYYSLSQDDIKLLNDVKTEVTKLNADYKVLMTHTSNHVFAYSKLVKEVELLVTRLSSIESKLNTTLNTIGSMREDESRARQQLEEIKNLLKDSKDLIYDYKFPVIPKSYYTELSEASLAIKEIITELNKKPIQIATLNTRVDTARDLTFKLYKNTKDLIKNAKFSELAIVYGNRFRPVVSDLDKHLSMAEMCYTKGDYNRSLEITINALNKIENGVFDKLLNMYNQNN